jgi:acetate kinase
MAGRGRLAGERAPARRARLTPRVRVLVVNAGSTSLKLRVVDERDNVIGGTDERASFGESALLDRFVTAAPKVGAVGHRVVHGGGSFRAPTVIDEVVTRAIGELSSLAPLHNEPALEAIEHARRALPEVPHVAVFDTAFHATIPLEAATYAVPRRWREEWGVRRYGFHGLSVQWAAELVPVEHLVVCHLGGGCSVTAVRDGRSIDTTMGFSPLEGVPMATRSGSVDPGALLYLLRERRLTLEELDHALEHESGLIGLAGTDDVRRLEGTPALDVYVHAVAGAVARMAASAGGLDALVFTAGVGEGSAWVREHVCARLRFMGVELDREANRRAQTDAELSAPGSRVAVHVVRAREEVVIARAARRELARGATGARSNQ